MTTEQTKRAQRPVFQVVAKIRTPDVKFEYQGTHAGAITLCFGVLNNKPKTRQRVLAELYQEHQKMNEREAAAKAAIVETTLATS